MMAALATVAMVTGCSSVGDPQVLHMAGEDPGTFGSAVPDVPSGQSYTFAAIPLCVDTGENATITEVSPVDGHNLEVVAFATTTDPNQTFGEGPVDLRGAGFDPESQTVTSPCPDGYTELALELKRESTAPGTGERFIVEYDTESGKGKMELPFQVRMCPGGVVGHGCAPA